MRVSTYEIFLPLIGSDEKPVAGKAALYNGLYSAIDVVDQKTAEKLRVGEMKGIPLDTLERLALRGHVTRKDEAEELADAQLLGRVSSKVFGYAVINPVILPTYDCNFRCPYCFERHRLTRGQEWLGHEMKPEMVEAVFSALKAQKAKGHRIDGMTLYGGEPLLEENKATVRNICEHAREMELSIDAVTNGYDLDKYIDLMEEFDIKKLQVTVDGVGEMNDRRRMHRDGVPTYERILKNIALALDHGIDISLRVNVNGENIGSLGALVEDLSVRGLVETPKEERTKILREEKKTRKAGIQKKQRKGFFSYYFKAVTEDKDSPTLVKERMVLDAIIAAGKTPMEAIERQSQFNQLLQGMNAMMEGKGYPFFSMSFCGAENGMLVIAPDGMLYSCWDIVAMEDEAIGFTDEETGRFFYTFAKAQWRLRTSDRMESCRTCPYILICRGGCAAQAKEQHGSYFREYCGEVKEIFEYVASRAIGRKWEETKRESLSVSLLGPLSRMTKAERETIMTSSSAKEILSAFNEAEFPTETEKNDNEDGNSGIT